MGRKGSELWRWVVGYEGRYKVSTAGRVKSVARLVKAFHGNFRRCRQRMLKQSRGYYPFVGLWDGGSCHRVNVHVLVLTAFVGPCPPGMECRHLDGNPANNRLENLAWGTKGEQAQDKLRHGRLPMGESIPWAKLTERDVKDIRTAFKSSAVLQKELARKYGVHQTTISEIVRGKIWRHVGA